MSDSGQFQPDTVRSSQFRRELKDASDLGLTLVSLRKR